MVRMLLMLNRTQDEIAAAAGIDEKTLRKHYADEIATAKLKTGGALMQTAMLKALGGSGDNARWQDADPGLLKWLLERVYDVKPAAQRHVVGQFDLSKLTDEQIDQFETLLGLVAPTGGDPSGEDEA